MRNSVVMMFCAGYMRYLTLRITKIVVDGDE